MGNAESLTGVQQWLLMYVMAKRPFDIVDIMIAEIEDAIMDGMGMTRQQPFAHWISWLLSVLRPRGTSGCLIHRSSYSRYTALRCQVIRGETREA
jgi:hypothetical protein